MASPKESTMPKPNFRSANRHPVLLALLGGALLSGCFSDDQGMSSSNAKGAGNEADGLIGDGEGGLSSDAGSTDSAIGTDSGATGDSADLADAGAVDGGGKNGAKLCATNKDCLADEHCALFYNDVVELTGDDDDNGNKTLPGWLNSCIKTDKALAKISATCDPFSADTDKSLLACHNASACQQGTCTALCETDADCPATTVCAASEVPIPVKDAGKDAYAFLVAEVCVPAAGGGKSCKGDADCAATEACRPHLLKADKLLTVSQCTTVAVGMQKPGGSCGAKSTGTGFGKLCGSALCQYTGNGTVAGICTAVCGKKSDCPETLSYGNIKYKTVCSSIFSATNDPADEADDTYIPQCILIHEKSTTKDCAATKTCAGTEACLAFAIARGPGQPVSVEHLCVEQATAKQPKGPPKKTGEACDPNAALPECGGGYCVDKVCSQTCNDDKGCANGTTCKPHTLIARPAGEASAATKLCLK
jgi:hypothetical protein